jgi:hypothetical protein
MPGSPRKRRGEEEERKGGEGGGGGAGAGGAVEDAAELRVRIRERYLAAVANLAAMLVRAYEDRTPLNLTQLKQASARRYCLPTTPKQVDIIAAIPMAYRDKLRPYLKAKPIRSASGISVVRLEAGEFGWARQKVGMGSPAPLRGFGPELRETRGVGGKERSWVGGGAGRRGGGVWY